MKIVDAQVHIWGSGTPSGDHRQMPAFTAQQLIAEMDVAGAARAGLRSCWINREARHWQHEEIVPDLQFTTLTALADWLDTHAG